MRIRNEDKQESLVLSLPYQFKNFSPSRNILATIWIKTQKYMIKCPVKKQVPGKMVLLINTLHKTEKVWLWKACCNRAETTKKDYQGF